MPSAKLRMPRQACVHALSGQGIQRLLFKFYNLLFCLDQIMRTGYLSMSSSKHMPEVKFWHNADYLMLLSPY